jgi:hypothetical protein
LSDVWVFAQVRQQLQGRKNVFVTVRATRLVVVMVMVVVARWSCDDLGRDGKGEGALYRGIGPNRSFLGVIAVSAAGKTDIHRTWRHVRSSQDAAHGGICRS